MDDLHELDLEANMTLVVGWRSKGTISMGRLEITKTISDHFRMMCRDYLQSLSAKSRRDYWPDIDLEPSEEYLYLHLDQVDSSNEVIVGHESIHLTDPLILSSLPSHSMLFYSLAFSGGPVFLRKTNSHHSVSSGKMFTRLSNTLNEINDPVFVFDKRVDLMLLDDAIIINNITAFEQLFRSEKALTAHLDSYVSTLSQSIPISAQSKETLRTECARSVRLRRRLEAFCKSDYIDRVDLLAIGQLAPNYKLDPTKLTRDNKLDIDKSNVEDVLKLLNDDFFVGGLSGALFVAEKKARR